MADACRSFDLLQWFQQLERCVRTARVNSVMVRHSWLNWILLGTELVYMILSGFKNSILAGNSYTAMSSINNLDSFFSTDCLNLNKMIESYLFQHPYTILFFFFFLNYFCKATYFKYLTSIHTDTPLRRLTRRKISSDITFTVDPISELSAVLPVFLAENSKKIVPEAVELRGEESSRCCSGADLLSGGNPLWGHPLAQAGDNWKCEVPKSCTLMWCQEINKYDDVDLLLPVAVTLSQSTNSSKSELRCSHQYSEVFSELSIYFRDFPLPNKVLVPWSFLEIS